MTTLYLDVATKTGYAYRDENGRIKSGAIDFKQWIPKKDKSRGATSGQCMFNVQGLIFGSDATSIIYEAPFMRGAGSRLLWALTGCIELLAFKNGIPVDELAATTVRKTLLGNGRATKSDIQVYLDGLGISYESNDESDAIAIMLADEKIKGAE